MKKLTSLQIIMLMNLALGSSSIYSDPAMLQLQAEEDQAATISVVEDLARLNSKSLEQIVKDVAHLEGKLSSIKNFVDTKNKEIEQLLEDKSAAEEDIAVLAVELADAQALFEKTLAQQEVKHKRKSKHLQNYQQSIKDAFMKAEQGLKSLNNRALRNMKTFFNKMHAPKIYKSGKRKKLEAQAAVEVPGVKDEVAKNLAEKNNISIDQANVIIDNALSNDEVVVQAMPTRASQRKSAKNSQQSGSSQQQSNTSGQSSQSSSSQQQSGQQPPQQPQSRRQQLQSKMQQSQSGQQPPQSSSSNQQPPANSTTSSSSQPPQSSSSSSQPPQSGSTTQASSSGQQPQS